jgi:chorismate mutase
VNAASVKPHPKEMTELAEDAFNTIDQFNKQTTLLASLDAQLVALDRQKVVAAVAKAKGKDATAVTDLEVAEYQLAEREKLVQSIDLTKQPLFSAKVALERFQARKKDIEALGNVPQEAKTLLAQEEQRLKDLVANEEIVEVEVDADVYDSVKNNLFPSFKVRTPILSQSI